MILSLDQQEGYESVCRFVAKEAREGNVVCVQQLGPRRWAVTTKDDGTRDRLLRASLRIGDTAVAATAADKQTTFVTILLAPFEMTDAAIHTALSACGKVLNVRRGRWQRHARMELDRPIPSYLRIGSFLLEVRYDGQAATCRRCGKEGHKAAACPTIICFNCREAGHRRENCNKPTHCFNCGADGHPTMRCPQVLRQPRPGRRTQR